MFKEILHRMAANPWIYDFLQVIMGTHARQRYIASYLTPINDSSLILDLGGGTGIFRELWPLSCTYVCLDNDIVKLQWFVKKYPDGRAILGDATKIPLKENSVDFVLCTAIAHHIPEDLLNDLIQGGIRALKKTGKFVFVDALLKDSWKNRLLWKYDRGAYPHTQEVLYSIISKHCQISHWQEFSIYFDSIIAIGTKP